MEARLKYGTLTELFYKTLENHARPQKELLEVLRTNRREKLTFDELREKAIEFAIYLIQKRGLHPGDKAAILGKNRADWDVALWGIILAGAVPVLIDPERPVEGVKKHLLHTDSRLLVMADDYQDDYSRRKLKEFAPSAGLELVDMTVYEKSTAENRQVITMLNETRAKIEPSQTAAILCTSGTTDDPREVELTHINLIANIQGALQSVDITADDKLGHIIPPHHSFGFTVTKLLPLWVGAYNVYTNQYRQIPSLINERGITVFVAVPDLFAVLAKKIEQDLAAKKDESILFSIADRCWPKLVGRKMIKKLGWRSLRFFISGAAPLPKWVMQVFWKRGLQLREGYGTTESSPIYGFNNSARKLGSVGRPIQSLLVKIVDSKNRRLGPGQKGEILLGGPCIVKGYYNNPEATSSVFETDGNGVRWLHTGDVGYLDSDGYLFITGRKKHLIVLPGGKNVHPELVELSLSQAKYVEEVVVVPSRRKTSSGKEQEAVKAIVRPAWQQIQADTNFSQLYLEKRPEILRNLLWQSINSCQRASRDLAAFERIPSKEHVEIKTGQFEKTSTGKIKRAPYIEV
jgi:long-chain acyl-CoA synthetase